MKPNGLAAAFSLLTFAGLVDAAPTVKSIEFIGMSVPVTADEKTDIYSKAQVKVVYRNGKSQTYDLSYHELMGTADAMAGHLVGGLYDDHDHLLTDADGQIASDSPDGNSLMLIPGMKAADATRNEALALMTQYEYKELPPAGQSGRFWSKLPATASLAKLDQDKSTGALQVADYRNISFGNVNGLWIACAASLSPWNTHLGSEEYEPDAKVRGGGAKTGDSDDTTDIASFSRYYFGDAAHANAYHYGLVPEVKIDSNRTASVVKHYALGRFSRELAEVMPDQRTAYMGDDGINTGLFMFVSDRPKDLSSGALYAAKWKQTKTSNGGTAKLTWIKLGSASDAEIKALVDSGIKFSDIFDASNTDPDDHGYKKVTTYTGTEWLRLKPHMEKAAAFLETRRYAAYLGATTEFSKMEGVTHDPAGRKAYVAISRIEKGMADGAGDIRLAQNDGGAVYELKLDDGHKAGINSRFVASTMKSVPALLGGWLGKDDNGQDRKDADGNRCEQDKVCGPDNLKFSPAGHTLFIGEDTSRRNNNYVWAYNVDNRRLTRILSTPMGAEAAGLQVVENAHGFSYIMSNFQHAGEEVNKNYTGHDKDLITAKLNEKWHYLHRAAIGYIGTRQGALPALK
ncbi:PhoX family protein [Methylocaldum sp.]|uniref:PhoX family protein n=1 Tax=Methylocaldum sp. TaxID=1969727 RepID=UPI002D46AF22|nr:alkaline phosphatase PhoX [Methylocaldum sp.]HYE35939.1 alkaline phosphatase PhoX [Methylocaldum sp.]